MLEINMGATAIGTGLNAVPGYAELCTKKLAELTGENFTLGKGPRRSYSRHGRLREL